MKKWLAIPAVALLVVLFFMWREMSTTEAKPAPAAKKQLSFQEREALDSPTAAAIKTPDMPPAPPPQPGKLDVRSDDFFYRFDEAVPKNLTRAAAKCYEGRHGTLHRNQKLSLTYKLKIVNGQVQVRDIKVKEDTINDPALTTCFIQQVASAGWKDDELPDWEQEDTLVLRPERGMKKFWQDNIDYVGGVAPPLDE
jgi:hypothetical protein